MTHRTRSFSVLVLGPFLVLAVTAQTTAPVEIRGVVSEVDGTGVTITLASEPLPSVGDAVVLSQEIPGIGPTELRGEWEVTDVGEDFAVAQLNGEGAKPQPGQQATITTTTPRAREQVRIDSAVFDAAGEGSAAGVHDAIGRGVDVDARGRNGWTPLMRAASAGHTTVMRVLLDSGADPMLEARGGQTALGVAAAAGHAAAVSLLLDAGAPIDTQITSPHASEDMRGCTPLILALRFGHTEAIRRLLRAGADPSHRTPQGHTALIEAINYAGHPDAVAALLEAGADREGEGPRGLTPLLVAAGTGEDAIVEMLVGAGADIEHRLPDAAPEPFAGMTPLLAAAHAGQADALAALLEAGADLTAVNLAGQTALELASAEGHDEVVAALRDPAGVVAARVAERNEELLEAVDVGDREAVLRLLQAGAEVNARDPEFGATALILAAWSNAVDVVRLLLEQGADVDLQASGADDGDGAGLTALMSAAWEGHRETVSTLLAVGADINLSTPEGETAASIARSREHEEVARMIESGG